MVVGALPDLAVAGLLVVLAGGPGMPERAHLVPVLGIRAAGMAARLVRFPLKPPSPVELPRLVEPLAVLVGGPGLPERSNLVPMLRRPALALSTLASIARQAKRWRVSFAGPLKNRAGRNAGTRPAHWTSTVACWPLPTRGCMPPSAAAATASSATTRLCRPGRRRPAALAPHRSVSGGVPCSTAFSASDRTPALAGPSGRCGPPGQASPSCVFSEAGHALMLDPQAARTYAASEEADGNTRPCIVTTP